MDFRLINEKTLPQVAALWMNVSKKKGPHFTNGIFPSMH